MCTAFNQNNQMSKLFFQTKY